MPVARRHLRLAARRARAHVARHAALAVFAALATVTVLAPAAASAAGGGMTGATETTEVAPSVAAAGSPALASPPPPAALMPPPLATAAATSSGYAPLGDVSRGYAFSDQRMTATAVDQPGRRAALIGAIGVGVTGDTPLRAGGGGAVTISLTHQVDRRVIVRNARVAVAIPAAYRPGRVSAPGWQCAPIRGRTLRCLAPGAVPAGQHAAIRLGLVARRPGRAHVRVRASWREHSAVAPKRRAGTATATATAANADADSSAASRAQSRSRARSAAANRPRTATGSATFTVRPPLRLRVTTAQRRVLGDGVGVDSAPIVLTGRLKRYDAGIPVDFRWRQLCGGDAAGAAGAAGRACPRVRWQSATAGRAAGRLVTAQADAPAVTRPTRLRFALSARDWRGAAQATATVVVLPQGQVKLADGDERIRVQPRRRTPRTRGYVMRRRVVRTLELTGSALAGPRPGQRVELRALPQGGTLQHIRWTVVARGARGTLRGTATNRETLSFVVPRRQTLTIAARGVISGTVVRARRTVYILHADHTRRQTARPRVVRAALASAAADGGTFCTLWAAATAGAEDAGTADAPIVLGGETARIVLGDAVASGADCAAADARIAFDKAGVSVGDVSFQDVEGSVTARGISLDAGWLGLPDGWWSDMPPRLRVTPGPAGTWGADLGSDDAWAPLHAQIALDDGVELLPLPEGWTFRPGESTLKYIPSTRMFALHSAAQAPAGQNGTVTLDGSITLDGATSVAVRADRVVELDGVDGRIVTLSGTGTLQTDPNGAGDSDRDRGDEPGYDGGEASSASAADGPRARSATGIGDEGSSLTGSIELRTDPAGGAIPLTSSVAVSNAVARWDSTGIEVSADVSVRSSRGTFAATARGLFESTSEWRLEIAQSAPFSLGDGVTLTDVVGTIQRTPVDPTDASSGAPAQLIEAPGAGAGTGGRGGADARGGTRPTARASEAGTGTDTFLVSLAGAVRGWSPSSALTDVEVRGAITNMCTPDEPSCSTSEVRLALEVRGNAHVRDQTIPWYGIAGVNLSTFAVRFEGGATLSDFGPDALHLDNIQLRLSTNGPAWCKPADAGAGAATAATAPSAGATTAQASQPVPGSPAQAPTPATAASLRGDQELTFSISATGRLLGEPFTAAGEFARSGYCITGTFGEFTPDGLPGGSGRRPLVDDVRFAYASKDADIALAGRTLRLRAGDVRLSGALNLPPERLPAQLRDVLGGRADLSLLLTRTGSGLGLSGAARFTFAQPQYVLGSAARADQARLGVTSVDLSFDYSATTSLRLEMAAKAALQTPANDTKGIAASRTPLFLAAGVNLGMPSINVSAGVDTTDPATDGTVRNAFGQQGLDVRRLLVSASIGADTSIGIAADATLPDGWTGALGMPARTPAKVTLSVSQTAPCLELEIGRMADPGAAVAAQPVMKLGPLAANWAQIVVAPMGCTIGNPSQGKPGYQIDPGFALGFDGQVGPTPVTFAAAMRKHGTSDFAVRGTVRVGAFDAGPVSFRRTSLDLDLDTGGSNRHFDVAFAGGLDAGQSTIDVEGRFAASDTSISAFLRGNGRLRFADTTFAQGSVDARLEFAKNGGSWTAKAADVSARTEILGADAGLLLSYRDGSVATAAGAFQYHAAVGPLTVLAGALFAYSPDGVRLDGNPNDCSISRLTPVRDGKELIVRLCSWMQLGPLSHSVTLNLALPQQWDFDFYVPRSEVGIYVASVYMQGELHASLRVGLSGLKFWVRGGNARAGGCVDMVFWSDCANGVYVDFKPWSGRFEGTVLGFDVSWGSDSWRTSPAPSGPDPVNNSPVGAGDRVLTQRAARVAVETKPVGAPGAAPRRTDFEAPRGGVPAQAVFDPERRQVTLMLPLPASVRAGLPRPTRAYMLTFSGVAFNGDDPVSRTGEPAWGGGGEPLLSYSSVEVARVPDAGMPVTRRLDRPSAFVLASSGRRFVWNTPPAAVPDFVAAGLPTSFAVELAPGARTPESRAALVKSMG